jgi:MFS family permease
MLYLMTALGIASALSGIADVPYLNEISPAKYRGFLSSQYEMAISVGVLLSFAGALALSGEHTPYNT